MIQKLDEPTRYSSSPSFFVSRRLSNQNLTIGTATRILFDTGVINDNGCFDFGASVFVCPKAGRMFLGCNAFVTNNTSTAGDTYVKISASPSGLQGNGALVGFATLAPNVGTFINGSFIADVEVGTNLMLDVFSFGTTLTLRPVGFGEDSCYVYGYYLP